MRRVLHEGANAPTLAGAGYEVVIPAVITAGTGKKDAAFQIIAKGLADIGLWRVVVALPVELTGTCQRVPRLKLFGNRLAKQRALGVTRVVEFGFGASWPTRVQMRVRWAGDGGHGTRRPPGLSPAMMAASWALDAQIHAEGKFDNSDETPCRWCHPTTMAMTGREIDTFMARLVKTRLRPDRRKADATQAGPCPSHSTRFLPPALAR